MDRRRFVILTGGLFAAPLAAHAQQIPTKIPRIGFLHPASPEGYAGMRLQDFRDGLHELGYVEGQNVQLEVRWGRGKLERMPALASELVDLKVDVIVAGTSAAEMAVHQATRTIPIVMTSSGDPVGDGLVTSLAHPGGNITGLSMMAPEMGAKRLQLMREMFPEASRVVAVLWNPNYAGMRARFEQVKGAAPTLDLAVRSVEVRDTTELEMAFETIVREHPEALVLTDPFTMSQRARIVEFVAEHGLPAIYENSDFVQAGGLMSYGPNLSDLYRRAATYVDKILRGAKPGDLPIEQPTKFELAINLKTAKALGITIPQSLLLRADEVIQ
jgi:putative ABC transport system substrate-binding protein